MARDSDYLSGNNENLLFWFLIGLVLLCGACYLYKNRKSEKAETVGSLGVLQIAIRICGTYIVGIGIGAMLAGTFSVDGKLGFAVLVAVGCLLAYLIGDILLTRNIKLLGKAVIPGLCCSGAVVAVVSMILTGGFGYESRVPALSDITEVSINYRGRYANEPAIHEDGSVSYGNNSIVLKTPEAVGLIRDVHAAQVEDHLKGNYAQADYGYYYGNLRLSYQLQNGSKMERRYYDGFGATAAQKLSELEANDEFIMAVHPIFRIDAKQVERVTVTSANGDKEQDAKLSNAEYEALITALRDDLLAQEAPDVTGAKAQKALGYLALNIREKSTNSASYYDVNVLVLEDYQNTLKVLRKLDLYDAIVSDQEKVTGIYVGLLPYSIDRGGIGAYQTRRDGSMEVSSIIFDDSYEAKTGFVRLSDSEEEQVAPYLRSIVAGQYEVVVVAVATETEDGEAITGYYYAPYDSLPSALKGKVDQANVQRYGNRYSSSEAVAAETY